MYWTGLTAINLLYCTENQHSHIVLSPMKHLQSAYLQDILLIVTTSSSTVYTVLKSLQDRVGTVQYTNADVYVFVNVKKKYTCARS